MTAQRWDGSGPPVLVLRALGLGDTLTAVPALRGLARLVAPRPVLLAAPPGLGAWMTALGIVAGCVPTLGLDDAPPGLRLGAHDAVDLHGNGLPSRELLGTGNPRRLLAFAQPDEAGVEWRADEHEVRRWCRLVDSVGAACDPAELRITPDAPTERDGWWTGGRRDRRVVVHPGAASESRRWPVERWAAVIRSLTADGADVIVTGGVQETELCARLVAASGLPVRCDTSGRLTLNQLTAVVGAADLVLSGDTGVAHLATALAVRSVVLFGPIAPSVWGPSIDPELHEVLWHGDGLGDPHGSTADPHLLLIEVDDVLQAAGRQLVGQGSAGQGSPEPPRVVRAGGCLAPELPTR